MHCQNRSNFSSSPSTEPHNNPASRNPLGLSVVSQWLPLCMQEEWSGAEVDNVSAWGIKRSNAMHDSKSNRLTEGFHSSSLQRVWTLGVFHGKLWKPFDRSLATLLICVLIHARYEHGSSLQTKGLHSYLCVIATSPICFAVTALDGQNINRKCCSTNSAPQFASFTRILGCLDLDG